MSWLFVATLVGLAGFFWQGSGRTLRYWLPATILFLVAPWREPSVVFALLFIAPTIILIAAAVRGKVPAVQPLAFALSDVLLLAALSINNSSTTLWSLPPTGRFGPGATLVVAAALLRLGAAHAPASIVDGGPISVGWWQGVFLAVWVGQAGATYLTIGAIVLVGLCLLGSKQEVALRPLGFAGGIVVLVCGLGAPVEAVVIIAAAGVAMTLGERVVSTYVLAFGPLWALTEVNIGFDPATVVLVAVGIPVFVIAIKQLAPAPGRGGRGMAVLMIFGLVLSNTSTMFGWWLAIGVVSWLLASKMVKAEPSLPMLRRTQIHQRYMKPLLVGATVASVAAVGLLIRLTLMGLSTSFL